MIEIGKGEAATITLARKYNGIVASNNTKDVKFLVKKYNLRHITTGDILVKAYKKGMISKDDGNLIWAKMLKRGRWLSANSFSDYLNKIKLKGEF